MNYKRKKTQQGLILMELIVSLGVFIAVMTIGMGAVLQMFGVNQKSQSLKAIMNNLNFALDSMAREIVVAKIADTNLYGSSLRCTDPGSMNVPQDCTIEQGGGDYLTFCSSDGNAIAYRFVNTDGAGYIERRISENAGCPTSFGSGEWERITSPEVNIQNMKFYVTGSEPDKKQPKVLMVIGGEAGKQDNVKSKFELQTTLSQRSPDLSTVLP